MADTNVRIKLSADGKQVREQIKLIDQELQEIGKGALTNNKGKPSSKSKPDSSQDSAGNKNEEYKDRAVLESLEKSQTRLADEISLLRKELEKEHEKSKPQGTSPSPSQNQQNGGNQPNNNQQNPGQPSDNSKMSGILGKLSAALAGASVVSKFNGMANQSLSGMSKAYQTFGSTLAYTDYNEARKDASALGARWGYNYGTVLDAGSANMYEAGFTNLNDYKKDMGALLQASKVLGVDANSMASTSGFMTSIGVVKNGEQRKFANLLSESMVQADMHGRGDAQLKVLESIAGNLAENSTKVSSDALGNSLGLYTALVKNNENLKGMRGAQIVNSAQSMAKSGDQSLNVLAGLGGKYIGWEGELELAMLAETDPTQYWKQVIEGAQRYGISDKALVHKMWKSGMDATKAQEFIQSVHEGKPIDINDAKEGEKRIEENTENYAGDKTLSTIEQANVQIENAKLDLGDYVNELKAPFLDIFNNMSDGGRAALTAGGVVGGTAATAWAGKKGLEFLGGLLGKTDPTQNGNPIPEGGNKYKLGKIGKGLGAAGVAYETISSGIDVYDAINRRDYREAAQETGGGLGTLAGGWAGATGGAAIGATIGSIVPVFGTAAGGALGGIIGGIGGALLGNNIGEAAGEKVYDVSSGYRSESLDNRLQLKEFYDVVSKLYKEKGNDAAQDYTNSVIAPYLKSIGVSQSIIDNYKTDIGKPDFLEDVENGVFGNVISAQEENTEKLKNSASKVESVTKENTEALEKNTEALKGKSILPKDDAGKRQEDLQKDENKNSRFLGGHSWTDFLPFGLGRTIKKFTTKMAVGNDYIPYDNYPAELHKGEMVLDKYEADHYRQGKPVNNPLPQDNLLSGFNNDGVSFISSTTETQQSSSRGEVTLNIKVTGAIDGMTPNNQNQIVQAVVSQVSKSGLQGMLANGFARVQNK